jgi:hypothetical protein
MNAITDILLDVDFLKIALPAGGAIVAWYLNERGKVRSEQLQRKEDRYKELLRCLKGFYVGREDGALKSQFIDQVGLCWLYAPDHVIQKANAFFSAIHKERSKPSTNEERERALADLILAIRKDMLGRKLTARTKLRHGDWKSFQA